METTILYELLSFEFQTNEHVSIHHNKLKYTIKFINIHQIITYLSSYEILLILETQDTVDEILKNILVY